MRFFFLTFFYFYDLSASKVAEEYEIRSAFVSHYTCYIEVQKKNIPQTGIAIGVSCQKQIAKRFANFEKRTKDGLFLALYGFPFTEVNLYENPFFKKAVISELKKSLEKRNSLYGRLAKLTILRLLEAKKPEEP